MRLGFLFCFFVFGILSSINVEAQSSSSAAAAAGGGADTTEPVVTPG